MGSDSFLQNVRSMLAARFGWEKGVTTRKLKYTVPIDASVSRIMMGTSTSPFRFMRIAPTVGRIEPRRAVALAMISCWFPE